MNHGSSINNSNETCGKGSPCKPTWNKLNIPGSSLTHLNGLSGTSEDVGEKDSIYGAQFQTVKYNTPYYEFMDVKYVETPWLGEPFEHGFMNKIKELNEPPVKDYKNLKLTAIPTNNYETKIYEGFDTNTKNNKIKYALTAILIAIIIICVMN